MELYNERIRGGNQARIEMFAPLSEYIENKLDEAFCKEFRVYGTYDKPTAWEDYKESFANWLIGEFTQDSHSHPRHPFDKPWDE